VVPPALLPALGIHHGIPFHGIPSTKIRDVLMAV
jgi:hypothetical protein